MPVKIAENQPNIVEKIIKKPSKILEKYIQKTMKNQPKIDQKSTKNRSWRPLGASWGVLKVLRASWGPLGGVLGASWAPLGGQHGSKLSPKREPKSIKNRSKNRSIFQCLLGSDFWKILVDFGTKMEASWPSKSNPKRCYLQKAFFWKNLVFP